jgi:hypothetical protein
MAGGDSDSDSNEHGDDPVPSASDEDNEGIAGMNSEPSPLSAASPPPDMDAPRAGVDANTSHPDSVAALHGSRYVAVQLTSAANEKDSKVERRRRRDNPPKYIK